LRIAFLKLLKAGAQSLRIKLADAKRSNTTLRATGTANKPFPAAACGIGQGCIDDLHKLLITGGEHFSSIAKMITVKLSIHMQ
jgi:hypothetical protein